MAAELTERTSYAAIPIEDSGVSTTDVFLLIKKLPECCASVSESYYLCGDFLNYYCKLF